MKKLLNLVLFCSLISNAPVAHGNSEATQKFVSHLATQKIYNQLAAPIDDTKFQQNILKSKILNQASSIKLIQVLKGIKRQTLSLRDGNIHFNYTGKGYSLRVIKITATNFFLDVNGTEYKVAKNTNLNKYFEGTAELDPNLIHLFIGKAHAVYGQVVMLGVSLTLLTYELMTGKSSSASAGVGCFDFEIDQVGASLVKCKLAAKNKGPKPLNSDHDYRNFRNAIDNMAKLENPVCQEEVNKTLKVSCGGIEKNAMTTKARKICRLTRELSNCFASWDEVENPDNEPEVVN